MMRIGVIHNYKSPEALACVLKQFEKQSYVNKFLVVFDTSTTPIPFSTKYIYANKHADLNTRFVAKSDEVVKTKNVINETSDALKTTLAKIKTLEQSISQMTKDDDATTKEKKQVELKTLQQSVKTLEAKKTESNTNLQTLKTQVDNLVKDISDIRKKENGSMDDDACMRTAVAEIDADVFTFMNECVYYHKDHLENGVRSFKSVANDGKSIMINRMFLRYFQSHARLFMYDKPYGLEHMNMFFHKRAVSDSTTTLSQMIRSDDKTVIVHNSVVLVIENKMSDDVKNIMLGTNDASQPPGMLIEYVHQMSHILNFYDI